MPSEEKSNLKQLLSNKFTLGVLAGFAIGMFVKNIVVAIVLLGILTLAWYSASKKKKEAVEEEI